MRYSSLRCWHNWLIIVDIHKAFAHNISIKKLGWTYKNVCKLFVMK